MQRRVPDSPHSAKKAKLFDTLDSILILEVCFRGESGLQLWHRSQRTVHMVVHTHLVKVPGRLTSFTSVPTAWIIAKTGGHIFVVQIGSERLFES